ncbi:hypothetical protein [Rossellomorea sp. LJF3]
MKSGGVDILKMTLLKLIGVRGSPPAPRKASTWNGNQPTQF